MLKLFVQALNGLPSIMGDRVTDFTEKVFGPNRKHMWNQLKNGDWARLTGYALARICNIYHIPVCHLIQHDGQETVFTSPDEMRFQGEWQDVTFTPENVYNSYQSGKFQARQFADAIGTTPSCIYRWFADGGRCTMTVGQALQLTYEMSLPLTFLFTDPNMPVPSHMKLDTPEAEERTLKEMQELRTQLQHKQNEIHKLSGENRRLREQHNTSAWSVSEEVGEYNNRVRPYIFNQALWDNLHIVFSVSKNELQRRTGVSTLISTPSVIQLVQVCNALRISFHHFVLRSVVQPQIQSATYYQDGYTSIQYVPERLNSLFCVGNILGQKRKDTLVVLGVSDMVSRRWVREESTLDVRQFVSLCNELDVTPSICIIDDSTPHYPTITELLLEENMKLRYLLMMERQKRDGNQETE